MTRKQFLRLLGFGVVAASLPKLPVAEAKPLGVVMDCVIPPVVRAPGIVNLEPFDFGPPADIRQYIAGLNEAIRRRHGQLMLDAFEAVPSILPHPEMKRPAATKGR